MDRSNASLDSQLERLVEADEYQIVTILNTGLVFVEVQVSVLHEVKVTKCHIVALDFIIDLIREVDVGEFDLRKNHVSYAICHQFLDGFCDWQACFENPFLVREATRSNRQLR